MPSLPPVAWVIFVLAVILVIVRIWAKRVEQHAKRIEDDERIPRSLEGGHASRRSKPETDSSDRTPGKGA